MSGEGTKNVCFCHAGGGGGKKWQNSVHVVVECLPLDSETDKGKKPQVVDNVALT